MLMPDANLKRLQVLDEATVQDQIRVAVVIKSCQQTYNNPLRVLFAGSHARPLLEERTSSKLLRITNNKLRLSLILQLPQSDCVT